MKGKVALVTGGTSGIGLGIVKIFVENEYNVAFCGKPDEGIGAGLESSMNESLKTNDKDSSVIFVACELTDEASIKNMVEVVIEKYGRLDCLINNAGRHPPPQVVDSTTAKEFTDLFTLNVMGYFLTSKYSLPHLRKNKGSVIFNSSLVANIGQLHAIPYVATKGAITAMSKAMAIDEAEHGVRVNCISPSNVWTPLWLESCKDAEQPDMYIENAKKAQLLGRMGTTEEIGHLCVFLARDAHFMTGVDIPVSGGAELNYGIKTRMQHD